MSHRLQLRRGTSAQNNKLTGLPGELTFDTDKKTLRVHDGETLGGFELCRKDALWEDEQEYLNSVPAEFWRNIVDRFSVGETLKIFVSSDIINFGNGDGAIVSVENSKPTKFATAELLCQTSDAGYRPGDVVAAFGIGARANPLPAIEWNPWGDWLTLDILREKWWVSHRETGVKTFIINGHWKLQMRVWQ